MDQNNGCKGEVSPSELRYLAAPLWRLLTQTALNCNYTSAVMVRGGWSQKGNQELLFIHISLAFTHSEHQTDNLLT